MTRTRKLLAALLGAASLAASLVPLSASAFSAAAMTSEAGDKPALSSRSISRLQRDETAIASAKADLTMLAAQKAGDDPLATMVLLMERDGAAFRYREAIRLEQADLLRVAADTVVANAVMADAPPELAVTVKDTVGAWRSIWSLAGIDEYNLVRIHPHPLGSAAPSDTLATYYQESAAHYQIDWTFLASINFIESDFGRVNGPSSAGALGPMQFMPATWVAYGSGGDVNNPRDAIDAAARYLFLSGARRNMDNALYAYNHDWDYVRAVNYYADAIRADPSWLERLYYWNTSG
jgi:soluble lytic murein transglycosylase-like protein